MKKPQYTATQYKIFRAIYEAFEKMGADIDLLAATGSLGDTLEDKDVLTILEDWHRTHPNEIPREDIEPPRFIYLSEGGVRDNRKSNYEQPND